MITPIKTLIGIDPGWSGAIAFLDLVKNEIDVLDCPNTEGGIYRLLDRLNRINDKFTKVRLERVHAAPKFGAKGNFRLGENYMAWKLALGILEISYETITPAVWQKIASHEQGKTTKEKTWRYVRQCLPELNDKLGNTVPSKTSRAANRADALGILLSLEKDLKG
jgi:hypothetical protein